VRANHSWQVESGGGFEGDGQGSVLVVLGIMVGIPGHLSMFQDYTGNIRQDPPILIDFGGYVRNNFLA
jgi:hypothetical protein